MARQIEQKTGTRVICVLLLILSAVFYYHTYSFPKEMGPVASEYGSAFFPRFLLIFIAAMALVLIIQSFVRKNGDQGKKTTVTLGGVQLARSLALWLICMGFFAAWKHLGYLYTAPLFMLALGLLMGARKIVLLVCLAGLGPVMYLVFEKLLKVGL